MSLLFPFRRLVFVPFRRLVFVAVLLAPLAAVAQDPGIDPSRLPGIVVDDTAAKKEGTWSPSKHTRPFVGASYIYSSGGSGQRVEFPVEIPEGGVYQVLAAYTPGTNRSENAVYEIPAANGVQTVVVNQQQRPAGPFCFQPLGEFTFEAGMVKLTVSAEENKKGVVVADAIQVMTPEAFAAYKEDFEKNSPKLLAALKVDPNKPVTKAEEKKPAEPPQQAPPQFVRKTPAKPHARLTPVELDRLMQQHVGGIDSTVLIDDEAFLRRVTLDLVGR